VLNLPKILIDAGIGGIEKSYESLFGNRDEKWVSRARSVVRMALEKINNCDTLYHNLNHTLLVSDAGHAILKGKQLRDEDVSPRDWLHFNIAVVCHDIGFVHGICRLDEGRVFATGLGDESIAMKTEGTDAQLGPWHVDRAKQFIREYFTGNRRSWIDVDVVCDFIEATRFPVTESAAKKGFDQLDSMVRAADLIGQLADPQYLRKMPALYYELREIGKLEEMGYSNPEQMRRAYSAFYRKFIQPYLFQALEFLQMTKKGRAWAAALDSHILFVDQINEQPEMKTGEGRRS